MFNRKKKLVKPPVFDTHRIFIMMLEEKGLYPLTSDQIVLFKDKYGMVEFTYLEYYTYEVIYLN